MFLDKFKKTKLKNDHGIIAALDVGNHKISCAIARLRANEGYRVVGVGCHSSKGIKAGHIIDMQEAELSILKAVHLAEQMAQESIQSVYVAVPMCYSQNIESEMYITGQSVSSADIVRLLQLTKEIEPQKSLELVHTIPIGYDLDGRGGIRDPSGMFGEQFGVSVHKIYTHKGHLKNLTTCINRCHLDVSAFVASPLAAGLASLMADEMDLGAIIVDMGAELTTIGVFIDGNIIYTGSISMGGEHITKDIARALSTPLTSAERLKTLYGSAFSSTSDEREIVKIPQILDGAELTKNSITKGELIRVIRPRIDEILEHVKAKLSTKALLSKHISRVILTGGASQLPGIAEAAAQILEKQIRLAKPVSAQKLHSLMNDPSFAVCAGLLTFAHAQSNEKIVPLAKKQDSDTFYAKISKWMHENL